MINWQITHLDEVDSTMNWARDQNLSDHSAVIADVQTAGRGRRGRQWQSPVGNLYMSFVVGARDQDEINRLPFLMGLAVKDALPDLAIKLKWPNDIWIKDKKLAGILFERFSDHRDNKVIGGLGLNINHSPKDIGVDLSELGIEVDKSDLVKSILNHFDLWRDRLDWAKEWNRAAAFMHDPVTFLHGDLQKSGVFQGINQSGHAILLDPKFNIPQTYASGEISTLRPE